MDSNLKAKFPDFRPDLTQTSRGNVRGPVPGGEMVRLRSVELVTPNTSTNIPVHDVAFFLSLHRCLGYRLY